MILGTDTLSGKSISSLTPSSEEKVRYSCDDCGNLGIKTWHNHRMSSDKRKQTHYLEATTLCRRCASRRSGLAKRGKPAWNKGVPSGLTKEKSGNWKGGRYISSDGYVMIHVRSRSSSDGNSGWSSYRKEHLVVMETHLGRKLLPNEHIHHIDGDKQNNDIGNLFLFVGQANHSSAHLSLRQLGYFLVKQGLVIFQNGKYKAHGKLCELLETPEEGNQQPSQEGNLLEGSTTRKRSKD